MNYLKKGNSAISAVTAVLFTFCLFSIPLKAKAGEVNMETQAPSNIQSASKNTPNYRDGEFIVKFKANAAIQNLNDLESVKKELNKMTKPNGIEVISVKSLGSTGAKLAKYKGSKNPQELTQILKAGYSSNIEYVEPNYTLKASDISANWVPSDPYYNNLWGLKNTGQYVGGKYGTAGIDIGAEKAWNITKGSSNVVVAVIDTGVDYTHPDLINNMWKNTKEIPNNNIDDDGNGYVDDVNGWDFYSYDNDPMDDNRFVYHGTHVAGTIAASANTTGVVGVAPNVKIMPLKFLGASGLGYTSDAVLAIDYSKKMGAKISNNSWGGASYSYALYDAIYNYGGLFAAAAGNTPGGNNNDLYPAYPASYTLSNILAVAAIDNTGALAGFSHYGAYSVDVAAPGVYIYSTKANSSYQYLSGTSMATPHAAGAAALVLSLKPTASTADIKSYIMKSVVKLPSLNGKTVTGGMVNAYAALAASVPVPRGVTAASAGYNSIKVSWSAAAGVSGYEVYRAASSTGTYSLVSSTTSTSVIDTGLTTGTAYYYKVKAYISSGTAKLYGGYSYTVSAKPVPAVPARISAVSAGYNSINISWSPVAGASGYEIYFYSTIALSSAASENSGMVSAAAVTSYTHTGLITGNPYYYKVRAYTTVGTTKVYGGYSYVVSAKPMLSIPANFSAVRVSSTSIMTSWGAVAGANGYEVYRATSGTQTYSPVTATTALNYTNTGLTTGTVYYYKVRAYRMVGTAKVYSNWTAVKSVIP